MLLLELLLELLLLLLLLLLQHASSKTGLQQQLDNVLDPGTQNCQRDFTMPAPMGKRWKGFLDFDLLPEKIQDLSEAASDGGYFGCNPSRRDISPLAILSPIFLRNSTPPKFSASRLMVSG